MIRKTAISAILFNTNSKDIPTFPLVKMTEIETRHYHLRNITIPKEKKKSLIFSLEGV